MKREGNIAAYLDGMLDLADIPRKQVCEMAGFSETLFSRFVNGERTPHDKQILAMGRAFGKAEVLREKRQVLT